jgi:glutathione S-transferase
VIEDDGETIAESATILRYLVEKYGDTTHRPPHGTPAFWRHEALLDYVEGSFAPVALRAILPAFAGKPVPEQAHAALDDHLAYIAGERGDGPLLFGEAPMLADIQFSYLLAMLDRFGLLEGHPAVADYWKQLQRQPGYIAATEAAGPMAPPLRIDTRTRQFHIPWPVTGLTVRARQATSAIRIQKDIHHD